MSQQLDLKKTINLPRTDFSMKANLPSLEPLFLQEWDRIDLYSKIRASRKGRPIFLLHDGPPYANGHIHLGHALNKILKDLIVKSKTMEGYDSPYLPGWDCHGLPIEIKVVGNKKKTGLDLLQVRRDCRSYARKYVEVQKQEFKRLGVFGEWGDPYLTMSSHYQAETARLLARFAEQDIVYRGLKPVYWCISCETALAEAEVEYSERTSPSIYVKFPVLRGAEKLSPELAGKELSVLIWTTTPWTLPANLAICFHPEFEYSVLRVGDEYYLLARDRVPEVARECAWDNYSEVAGVKGEELRGLVSRHPWLQRESVGLLADHVTLEQGTGAVHTAPGHGHEDYRIGVENGLEVYCPVDSTGRFTPEVEHFAGLQVFDANPVINRFMAERGVLVAEAQVRHSYPHCWRCHNPVIFRATPQWFISLDANGLRARALEEIRKVRWIPRWGEERIGNMIAHRPDWCISRQRVWGVPIVAFYCCSCRRPLLSPRIIDRVADIFEAEGADAWYARPVSELLPEGTSCSCGGTDFDKERDILDVWFDSGASHHVVLGTRPDLPWPADLYLEGGDQYRGWFHSSLLIAVLARGRAPYRIVVCNGWTLDLQGRAMSKSLGNVISPLEVMKSSGAEILRLWVASINYTEDARLGEEILSRLRDAYRKLRNTARFLLGNLHDFDPSRALPASEWPELDRWALARLASVAERAEGAYRNFEFHVVYHSLYNFCVVDLSNFYFDVLKDRLYTSAPNSAARRASQSALLVIADTLVRLLAPILPFTAEEIWKNLHPSEAPCESVHMAEFSRQIDSFRNPELLAVWEPVLEVRDRVAKALEESRQRKEIGKSLEAGLTLLCGSRSFEYLKNFGEDLRFLFIVSDVAIVEDTSLAAEEIRVLVSRAPGRQCERCWTYSTTVGSHEDLPTVCSRCFAVLEEMGEVV